MPNINIRDSRNRDAVVRAEPVSIFARVEYVDKNGEPAKLRKVLKGDLEHGYEKLLAAAGDDANLARALIEGDPEVDIERAGMFVSDASRVYINERNEIVFRIEQVEIVRTPGGEEKERRSRRQTEPNLDSDFPVSLTGRLVKKEDALRRFVFSSSLQIAHVNGLTYDFLFAMAKELDQTKSLMLLGAGKSGKEPLILRRGAIPYRGFLEGRLSGDKYCLLLHLSNLELKRPLAEARPAAEEHAAAAPADAKRPASPQPLPEKTPIGNIAPPRVMVSAKKELVGSLAKARAGTQEKKRQELTAVKAEEPAAKKGARKRASAPPAVREQPKQ
jgi:hypothetical protein